MALPTLDATFASSVDLPRRQMLAKWLVEELGEVQAPSNVLVSGAGSSAVNDLYLVAGVISGKNSYNSQSGSYVIAWNGSNWLIRSSVGSIVIYISSNNVEFPWQVTTWVVAVGDSPVPSVSESPSVNPIAKYYDLPERYLWAKIAVAVGGPKTEAAYISLPKNYAWSDIYDAVAGSNPYIPIVDPSLALNVAQNSNGNRQGAWYNKVTLTVAEGELVNVESLRFTFLEPVYHSPTDGANSTMLATGYREIDVIGTPSPFPPPLQAELTYENNWNYIAPSGVTLSGTNYFASTNDLANAGQPTLASTVWSGGESGDFGSSPAQLNNGLYAAAELTGGVPNGFVDASSTATTLLATPNSTYTINFNGGVDITSVNVYSAMTGVERAKQNWKLEYRTAGSGTTDWSENVALGHIAAAYRGDTGNPEALATYINWPWRYKVASIITSL